MTRYDTGPNCAWVRDNLDEHLEGVLPESQARLIADHLKSCDGCRNELLLAQKIQETFSRMEEKECPSAVRHRVLSTVRVKNRKVQRSWSWKTIGNWLPFTRRPLLAPLAVAAMLAVVTFIGLQLRKPQPVDSRELARAEIEVKWTLAYLSEVSRKSSVFVGEEIISGQVLAPVVPRINEALAVKPPTSGE